MRPICVISFLSAFVLFLSGCSETTEVAVETNDGLFRLDVSDCEVDYPDSKIACAVGEKMALNVTDAKQIMNCALYLDQYFIKNLGPGLNDQYFDVDSTIAWSVLLDRKLDQAVSELEPMQRNFIKEEVSSAPSIRKKNEGKCKLIYAATRELLRREAFAE